MDVSVRDLKNRLSEYLRRVQAGEEVVVTSRGKAVARLSAPRSPQRGRLAEEQAVALVRSQPWIRPGQGKRRVPRIGRAAEAGREVPGRDRRGRAPVILYLDTSALVKLFVAEAHCATVRRAVQAAAAVATHLVAYAEACSA